MSQLLNFSVVSEPENYRVTASWTRPLILSTDLFHDGYVQLTSGPLPFISAMREAQPAPYEACRKSLAKHDAVGQANITFDSSATPSPPPTPSPSPSPLYKTCIGSPCYNSVSWRSVEGRGEGGREVVKGRRVAAGVAVTAARLTRVSPPLAGSTAPASPSQPTAR